MAAAPDPELVMAACRSDTNKLKDLLLLLLNDKVSAEQQGARETRVAAVPVQQLDPQLVMAARRGDVNKLKELLVLNDDGDEEQVVIVEVDRRHPPPAAAAAAASRLRLDDGGVTMDGDSLLHIVASCGDSEGYRECAKLLLMRGGKREKLVARNHKGDTPLHSAASAGNAEMVSCLVARAGDDEEIKELLRMRNNRRETALCEAVRAASTASVDKMMSLDPELACIPGDGEEGAPPMYLAVSFGEMNIAQHLFNTSKGKLSYSGPHGRNVLHEAVSRGGQVLSTILKWFKDDVHQEVGDVDYKLLLPQLTLQKDQLHDGRTPLHLAALHKESETETTLLLDANSCATYQPDNQGLYPIHIAAMAGNLNVVKALLRRCPDCATLRDAQGATFLHVAVDKERRLVVRFACRKRNPQFSSVLNVQDNDGDTALHRAIRVGDLPVFNFLIGNRRVRLDVSNDKGLTPLDLACCPLPSYSYIYQATPSGVMRTTLLILGAHGGGPPNLFKHIAKRDEDKEAKNLTDATQVMGIVSVLVATVTFAAAFTLPGGYRSADDAAAASPHGHAGTALLAAGQNYAFNAFIIADTLAFICSCGATFALLYAGLPGIQLSVRYVYFNTSYALLVSTARSLLVTFALGLYLVLAPVAYGLAVAVCVLSSTPFFLGTQETVWTREMNRTVSTRFGANFQVPIECWVRIIFFRWVMPYWSLVVIFGLPAVIIALSHQSGTSMHDA